MITAKGLSAGRHIFLETTYQVRFETLAYPLRAFPSSARFKRWYAYPPTSLVCLPPRSTSSSAYPGSESGHHFSHGTAKCPESLCPTSALPPLGRLCSASSEGITPPSSLLRTHAPNPLTLPSFGIASFEESSQVATSPCCQRVLPDVISASPSQDARAPTTTACRVLLPVTSPATSAFPKGEYRSASRKCPLKRLHSGTDFRGCSHFLTFRPLSLLATLVAPTSTVSCRADGNFYVRAEHASLPPHASDMLVVRIRQLTTRGLPPRQTRSLVGCSSPFSASIASSVFAMGA